MDYDCIVIGAGPTGAVLAALLGQAGHRVLVIERDAEVYPLPRAVHMDHEIARVMQEIGVSDALLAGSSPVRSYRFLNGQGDTLLEIGGGDRLANSGHPGSVMFFQPELEALLRARLQAIPPVAARFGATATALEAGDDGVTVRFEHEGTPHSARAPFLVGCDGASSLVRRALGGGVEDLGFDEPWVVVDMLVRGDIGLPEDTAYQFCDPARPTTCVPAGPGRRRWEFMLLPGETREDMGDESRLWSLLEPWGGPDRLTLVRHAVYRFHALIVERWRAGRVLLAGDAAHQTPPFMGQGLCSGVRDAANLAWKLDLVLRGRAPDALLDTYQTERAPHFRHVVETSVAMGRIVCELDPERAAARDRQMIEARRTAGDRLGQTQQGQVAPLTAGVVRAGDAGAGLLFPQPFGRQGDRSGPMDEVMGGGLRLVVDDAAMLDGLPPADADAVRTIVLNGSGERGFIETGPPSAASWLGHQGRHAALVRPDHYVFGTATDAGSVAELLAAYHRAVGA